VSRDARDAVDGVLSAALASAGVRCAKQETVPGSVCVVTGRAQCAKLEMKQRVGLDSATICTPRSRTTRFLLAQD